MAAGGWVGGRLFDETGSYEAAFLTAGAVNVVNLVIVACLLFSAGRSPEGTPSSLGRTAEAPA